MMRFSRYLFLLLVLSAATALSQPARFNELTHDFGEMKQNEARSTTFTVYNTGPETLNLTPPRASCGCTAALLSQSEVKPGDSARIAVEFRSGVVMLGFVSKTIRIGHMANGQDHELATLRISAEVVGDLRFEPGMLQFRNVIGDTVRMEVVLRSNSSDTVHLGDITPGLTMYVDSSEGNTYRIDKVVSIPFEDVLVTPSVGSIAPGDEGMLTVVFTLRHKGQINGAIRVGLDKSEIRIPVVGVVLRSGP